MRKQYSILFVVIVTVIGSLSLPSSEMDLDPESDLTISSLLCDPVDVGDKVEPRSSDLDHNFIENQGQLEDGGIRLYSHGEDVSVAFGPGWVLFSKRDPTAGGGTTFRIEFPGSTPVEPVGSDPLGHPTSFLKGPERDWIVGAQSFGRVTYSGLWEGVEIVYHFQDTFLKYDVMLAPGVDPTVIRFRYVGVEGLELDRETGDLVVRTLAGELREDAPVAFDERVGGRSEVDCRFDIVGEWTLGFVLEGHDPALPLVIDPGLEWGTYLGSFSSDYQKHMAVDGKGCMYVVGFTWSNAFPTKPGSYDTTHNGVQDGFVVKLSNDGSSLEYATYLGGTGGDSIEAICVDDKGCAYLTGGTGGSGFPYTLGAYDTSPARMDAFVTKLNASGTGLEFSTFLGGSQGERGYGIDIDGSGNVFIHGETTSTDLPVTTDAFDRYFNRGDTDAFMAKLNASGDGLLYCSYLGGGDTEYARDIHADGDSVFLMGFTGSDDFPTTPGAFDTNFGDKVDIYVTKVNVSAGTLVYSTYVGGGGIDNAVDLFVDGSGSAYVAGNSDSGTFPTKNPYQRYRGGWTDAIAFKLNPAGSDLVFSTFIGESDHDQGHSIAADSKGVVHVAGLTNNDDLPTTEHAFSTSHGGYSDAFYMRLSVNGSQLLYSTFIGGVSSEFIAHLQLDDAGYAYASGSVQGNGFPTTQGAYDTSFNGNNDAFAIKFDVQPPALSDPVWAPNATTGDPLNISVKATDNGEIEMVQVEYWHGTGGARVLQNLTLESGTTADGTWEGAINASPHTLEALNFTIHAWDGMGNVARPLTGNATVTDDDLPHMDDLTPGTEGTGNPLTISVLVEDNIGVSLVVVETWLGSRHDLAKEFVMIPGSTTGIGNGTYSLTMTVPWNSTTPIHYRLYVNDTSGNKNVTGELTVLVVDDDPPTFGEDASPTTADTDHLYFFSISAWDNIEVAEVWTEYRYGEGDTKRLNLTLTTGTTWEGSMIVADTLDDLHFVIWSNDTSDNVNSTLERTVDVIDINGPGIINEGTKSWATTGDPFEFTITAHDNVGLKGAILWYALDDGELAPVEMEVVAAYPSSGNTLYSLWIDVPSDQSENITYSYEIEDLYGNVLRTHVDIIRVRDDDGPEMVEDLSDTTATTGDVFHARIRVRDNIGIDIVSSGEVLWTGTDIDDHGNGIYEREVPMEADYVGPFNLSVELLDLGWNEVTYELITPEIVDNDPPEMEHDHGELLVPKGLECELHVTVRDNIGVGKVTIAYRFGEGTEESIPMERTSSGEDTYCEVMIPVPRVVEGPLYYRFTAEDASGNANATGWFEGTCVNRPPELKGDPPIWFVTEEATATLDLLDHIVDGNDPAIALTATCDAPGILVSGLVLQTRYDAWVPEHLLEVRVTDGEDTMWFNVTVRVTNVNDAPVIVSVLPENGSGHQKGESIRFLAVATDEDGDELTYTWRDGGKVIGEGAELDHDGLPVGERTITLEVSDGTASATRSLTVVVHQEEETATLALWLLLLVVLVVVGVAAYAIYNRREA